MNELPHTHGYRSPARLAAYQGLRVRRPGSLPWCGHAVAWCSSGYTHEALWPRCVLHRRSMKPIFTSTPGCTDIAGRKPVPVLTYDTGEPIPGCHTKHNSSNCSAYFTTWPDGRIPGEVTLCYPGASGHCLSNFTGMPACASQPSPPKRRMQSSAYQLTPARCERLVHGTKFFQMWAAQAWKYRSMPRGDGHRRDACWGQQLSYFEQKHRQPHCDVNWLEGSVGGRKDRPQFHEAAPALLGYDGDIFDFCTEKSHSSPPNVPSDKWTAEVGKRCIRASLNILRLISTERSWNMCQNLEWIQCALQGLLPGQKSPLMKFAHAPRDLDTRDYEDPSRTGSWWLDPHDTHYAVSDVFFAEVCMLSSMCSNREELFTIGRGDDFTCAFDGVPLTVSRQHSRQLLCTLLQALLRPGCQ